MTAIEGTSDGATIGGLKANWFGLQCVCIYRPLRFVVNCFVVEPLCRERRPFSIKSVRNAVSAEREDEIHQAIGQIDGAFRTTVALMVSMSQLLELKRSDSLQAGESAAQINSVFWAFLENRGWA